MYKRRAAFLTIALAVVFSQFSYASTLVHGGSAAVPAQSAIVFDFTSNICSAVWWSGAGQLPCPLADHDARGYVVTVNNPLLEDGTTDSLPGLVVGPQNKTDGYLQGFYPEYTVQPGDHFQTVVGCANGSSCFVTYRLDYRINGGAINILWKWKEANEGRVFNEDFDLTALAGKKVSFILTLLATGSPIGDRAIWGHPHIVGAGAPAPTLTPAPATATSPGPTSSAPTATVPTGSQPPGTVVDFTSNICSAKWWSGAGQLPCPIADHDARGYVVTVNNPLLEDGTTDSLPGLVVGPQNKTDGYLQGFYPEYTVQPGDHFQTVVGCANGSSCFVTYRLDYRINGGAINILWKWKEANEGRVLNEDLDLSSLAGKKVRFILTLLATGSPIGDRAIWGHPRIVRAGFVPPTATSVAAPGSVTNVTVQADPTFTACGGPNVVDFSGAITANGATDVTYHWEVGGDATAGTPDQQLAFSGAGTQTISTDAFKANCGSYFVRLVVTAPNSIAAQANFIIGTQTATATPPSASATPMPTQTFMLTGTPTAISTTAIPPAGTNFDFTSNLCAAKWWSGAGQLACPMADRASTGYAVMVDNPLLEDGTADSLPGLVIGPQNKTDGYIQGFYPDYTVQPGDHFQAAVGCANGSSCFVTYRLDYRINGGAINILWSWKEANDNKVFNEDFDLSSLAGKKVSFILTMLATGSASGDRAIWGHPRIVLGKYTPPTATKTAVPTPVVLRGKINLDLVSCRYGPGAMYLYLYGLKLGAVQDVVGRTDTGAWVLTRAHGDNVSCWVNADFLDLNDDVMKLPMVYPDHYTIPPSNQGYRAPWDVAGVRVGDQVVIDFKTEERRPGDQEDDRSVLYLIETWVCRGGRLVFTPIGSFTRQVNVTDEPGCDEPSHGRVYFAEKHGYTGPSAIPWPAAASTPIQVYFYQNPGLLVVPVQRLASPTDVPQAALIKLFEGPTAAEQAQGFTLPADGINGFSSLTVAEGVANVFLTGNCNSGGSTFTIAGLIRPTLLQFAEIQHVRIYDQNGSTENSDPTADSIPACLEP